MIKYVVTISSWSVAYVLFTDMCQAGCFYAVRPVFSPLQISPEPDFLSEPRYGTGCSRFHFTLSESVVRILTFFVLTRDGSFFFGGHVIGHSFSMFPLQNVFLSSLLLCPLHAPQMTHPPQRSQQSPGPRAVNSFEQQFSLFTRYFYLAVPQSP